MYTTLEIICNLTLQIKKLWQIALCVCQFSLKIDRYINIGSIHTLRIVLFVLFQRDDIAVNRQENAVKLYNIGAEAKAIAQQNIVKVRGLIVLYRFISTPAAT